MKKAFPVCFFFILICLTGCAQTPPPPEVVVKEVTRIVQVSSTPVQIKVTQEVYQFIHINVTQTPTPGPAYDCYQTAMTQGQINNCAILEYNFATEELNKSVSFIMANLPQEEQKLLEQSQKDWQTQMERDCEFFYGRLTKNDDGTLSYKGGSMAPMNRAVCMSTMTIQRNQELRNAFVFH